MVGKKLEWATARKTHDEFYYIVYVGNCED